MTNQIAHQRAADVVGAVEDAGIVAVIRIKDPSQLRAVVDSLSGFSVSSLAGYALAIRAVVIGTRLVWAFTIPYLIRAIDRREGQRARRTALTACRLREACASARWKRESTARYMGMVVVGSTVVVVGLVFGISRNDVTPPFAQARVAVCRSSLCVRPGSRKWT